MIIDKKDVQDFSKFIINNGTFEYNDYTIYVADEDEIRFRKGGQTAFYIGVQRDVRTQEETYRIIPLSKTRNVKRDEEYQRIWSEVVGLKNINLKWN